ncbi:MAG: hypothetical protein O2910_03595 [Proteobacteria bacterium]|nr:hypothetical protein [Pseudomonadota bacterium]
MSNGVKIFPVIAVTVMVLLVAASIGLLSGVPQIMPDVSVESAVIQAEEANITPLNLLDDVKSTPLSEIRDRNVFTPLKTLLPPAPTKVAGHELRGTVVSDDGGFALMAKPGAEAVVVVARGDALSGWQLVGLAANRAIFEKNGQRLTLWLKD